MKILENMNLCYGCAACVNACAVGAISMVAAKDGFLYPQVDDAKCVNCNACRSVCPQLNATYDNVGAPEVYAVMAEDDIRAVSASGGMFTLLAEYALEKDAYICGCAFSPDFRSARHIMIHRREDLDLLRRSKYIQSENGDIYKQVREKLKEGAFVMFTGTPCQCAALKAFLKKPYDNLLLVDLICHGTPSPLAWNRFLEETAPGKAIKDVNFRYKGLKGWSVTTHIEFEDGTEYTKHSKEDLFEQAATKNFISRKSCSTCQFARVPRQGDLTIGDFWDIVKYKKALDDRKGTSAVIVNSEKGKKFLEEVLSRGGIYKQEQVPFYEAFARRNSNVYRFPPAHPGREVFFDSLSSGKTFAASLNAAKKNRYDVMLFGIWYGGNYGSVLTNFALYQFLEDEGYNCIFADIPEHLWPDSRYNRDPLSMPHKFCLKHFKLSFKYKNRTDLKKVNELADAFIVGSDQLWNYPLCRTAETLFYLDFVDDDKKKIAYGTSFGYNEIKGTAEEKRFSGFYLNRFDAVSVREDYAVELCKKGFGVDAVQVLDPVFMCDKSHYERCLTEAPVAKDPPKKKYVLAYILDPTDEKLEASQDVAKRMKLELVCLANARMKGNMEANWKIPKLDDLTIEDWLWYFKNAETVVTDSFHGTCFSIIFEKPFFAVANKGRGSERFFSLAGMFGLEKRIFNSPVEIIGLKDLTGDVIDYEDVNARIAKERERSLAWVKQVLDAPKHPMAFSAFDATERHLDKAVKQMNTRADSLKKQLDALTKKVEEQEMKALNAANGQVSDGKTSGEQLLAIELMQQLEMQTKKFEEIADQYQRRIAEMENSASWKLTKPLRTVRGWFKKK